MARSHVRYAVGHRLIGLFDRVRRSILVGLCDSSSLLLAFAFLAAGISGCTTIDRESGRVAATADGGPEESAPARDVPVPEIPSEELPPATGVKPDSEKDQYSLPAVSIRIDEFIEPRGGQPYVPKVRILEEYLAEYFRRAGHPVVAIEHKAEATYVVVGNFFGRFDKLLKFRGNSFATKYLGDASLEVQSLEGQVLMTAELEQFPVEALLPEKIQEDEELLPDPKKAKPHTGKQRPEEFHAVVDLRRKLALGLWEQVFHRRGVFGDPEVSVLLGSLTDEDPEAEEAVNGDAVLQKLIHKRFAAVPYLLEALSDKSPVLVPTSYPGLTPENVRKLLVYHLADKALEEIFQKVSRMGLDTPDRHRFLIIRGWENEWRRFCPSFRESPKNPSRPRPVLVPGREEASTGVPSSKGSPSTSDGR